MKKLFVILTLYCFSQSALADKKIKLKWLSDLDFGTAIQGDLAVTVPPGSSESSGNASFRVSGAKNESFTIILPTGPVNLTGTSGGTVTVSNFQSFPPQGANGHLDNTGDQTVYIGATRASIPLTQPRGTYTGSFPLTVAY